MHIMEGFLPVKHAIGWTLASAPFVAYGIYSIKKRIAANPEQRILLGVAAAFSFVLSALKLPSVTGSCSHPTGTGLGALLFGVDHLINGRADGGNEILIGADVDEEATQVFKATRGRAPNADELKALRKIKRQYEQLKLEHDLLKKAIAFTSDRKARSSPSSSTTRKPVR